MTLRQRTYGIDAPAGVGLWEPSNAPVSSPSRGSQGLRNLKNCARTRMHTEVARIVTTGSLR